MSRPSRVRVLALSALLAAAGCQDYNFNPVGHCLISPNTKRVQLSSVSRADVLFVVDDSGSMGGEQLKLSAAFTEFINNLDAYNQNRVKGGLEPFGFHLAVTTTSVFYNDQTGAQCRSDCPGAATGGNVCCAMSSGTPVSPYKSVKRCTGAGDACGGTEACRQDCKQFLGEWVCCDPSSLVPALDTEVPCTNVGDACGTMTTHYLWDNPPTDCDPGHATRWSPFPAGNFVNDPTAARVVHFDPDLYKCATPPCTNKQGLPASTLKTMFTKDVVAGTCGSNQEQPLQAAKLAVEKALAGKQRDVLSTTDGTHFGDYPADWLQEDSKLVLVFVGDEDDCSGPAEPSAIVMTGADPGTPGEACVADAALPADKQKEYSVQSFVDYFTSLPGDRPLSAAFIVSARSATSDSSCTNESCYADICCDTACTGSAAVCSNKTCGGQAKGSRLLDAAAQLRSRTAGKTGVEVIAGSICDGNFGQILNNIADITKPPDGLLLPTQPADAAVSVLRIATSNGKTRKTCYGPAPATLTATQARAANYDWWYTAAREAATEDEQHPTVASRFVLINHGTGNCEANPGETYSADYIARLPTAGCSGATAEEADASCVAALGGRSGEWTCYAGTDAAGVCVVPTGGATGVVGTCLCGARGGPAAGTPGMGNCPNG